MCIFIISMSCVLSVEMSCGSGFTKMISAVKCITLCRCINRNALPDRLVPDNCPEAEKAADATIALPIYPELTEAMQTYVVEKIVQFYS